MKELASRWLRLGGAVLDGIIMMVIELPVMFMFGIFNQVSEGQGMTMGQLAAFFVFHLMAFAAVNGWLLAKRGQTVGKMIVGTRIVDLNGNLRPFKIIFFIRYALVGFLASIPLLGSLFSLANALFIFRSDKRCLHDLIAGTKVVQA